MHFVLQTPSLQHQAGVKIVAHLWSQRDIIPQIARLNRHEIRQEKNEWKEIEEKVEIKVWALPLPQSCKKHLLNLIKPLGMEIIRWCRYHCEDEINFQYLDTLLPQLVCWSMHGTVDYGKTAKSMAKDDRLDVEKRYEIACINCLEDEARELFKSIGGERRREYAARMRNRTEKHYHELVLYFNCTFNDDAAHLRGQHGESFLRGLFRDALYHGTRATCEYLFKKLNQREKDQVVEEWEMPFLTFLQKPSGGCISMGSLMFYLSLLNEEQQKRVFIRGRDVYRLLQCLLRWPMQSLFVKVAECGWQFVDRSCKDRLLRAILFNISSGLGDYDYCQLFWECWRLNSDEYKQEFLGNVDHLVRLFKTKEDFILLVLNEAPWFLLKQLFVERKYYDKIKHVLLDESLISCAALMDCKQTAALNSSNDKEDAGKRFRSEYLTIIYDIVIEERSKG